MSAKPHRDFPVNVKNATAAPEPDPNVPTDDDWIFVQDLLMGINDLPNVRPLLEAYLIGRGYTEIDQDFERLRKLAYGEADKNG